MSGIEIKPIVFERDDESGEEDVVWTTDEDATHWAVYERDDEGLAHWHADYTSREDAEHEVKFLLTRSGAWATLTCGNPDCDGRDWEDHAHPPVGARIRVRETGGYQGVGDMGNVLIEADTVGTVLDSDTDNHSAIVAIPGRALAWVPLIDLLPFVERY